MPERESPSHELIPQHKLLPKDECEKLLAEFKVTRLQIPKIKVKDAGLAGMGVKAGQIIEVSRQDGSKNYRLVIE